MSFILALVLLVVVFKLNSNISNLRARVEHVEKYLQKTTVKPSSTPLVEQAQEGAHAQVAHDMVTAGTLTLDEYGRLRDEKTQVLAEAPPHTEPAVLAETQSARPVEHKEASEFKFSSTILVWVGVFAVLLGVGFFLKYTFENDIIGPTGQVLLGILTGFIFLGVGEYLHARYEKYAHMLSGAGIGLLYLSFYGTLHYNIGSPLATLFFMGLVTATSLVLSVRYESRGIAILGLVGGYGTPLFFGDIATGLGGFVLLNYLLILTTGVLVLAYFKNWSWAVWSSFAGTAVLMGGWLASPLYDVTKFDVAFAYLSIFWLLFTLATLVFYYFHDRTPTRWDALLLVAVGVHYAATVYGLLYEVFDGNKNFFGLIPLVLATLYAGIAYLGVTFRPRERSLALYPLGMAVLFLTLVFPFEFDGQWLTVAWFAEASVLALLALFLGSNPLARFAAPVYLIGVLSLFSNMPRMSADTLPILNERFFLYAFAVASAFSLMYAFTKLKGLSVAETVEPGAVERSTEVQETVPYSKAMFIVANILIAVLVLGEMDIYSTFVSNPLHTFVPIVNARFLLLFVVALYAYSIAFYSLRTASSEEGQFDTRTILAFLGANVLVLMAGISEVIDYARFADGYHAILNARTLVFLLGVAYTGGMSYIFFRGVQGLFAPIRSMAKIMFVALNAVLVVWGLLEIADYYAHLTLYTPIFNVRTSIVLLATLFTAGVSYALYRFSAFTKEEGESAASGYFVATNVLMLLLGVIEILDYHNNVLMTDAMSYILRDTIGQQASMYVTGYLVLYGFTALVIGLLTRFALLRNIAITILVVAIAKVFLSDIWALSAIYRIVALLSLGITLLVVGYLYYRYKDRTESVGAVANEHHE